MNLWVKQGVELNHIELVRKKMSKGNTSAKIAYALEEPLEVIEEIIESLNTVSR